VSGDATGQPGHVDVLVAGSGAAGLTAAVAAAAAGARVLVVEASEQIGGTTALSGGRIWVPGNHRSGNPSDTPEAARRYLDGLIPDRYAHMTEAFLAAAPVMARFVEARTPHRFAACPSYPDYHPSRPGATLGGRCLDMQPADLTRLTPLTAQIRVPPGYTPLTHAEWERWRYPDRFDAALLEERRRNGIRTGGVALVASLLDGAVRAGVRVRTGTRLESAERSRTGVTFRAVLSGGETIGAAAVILATGGFDWDADLRARYQPGPQRASGAPPGNTGDGLRIACDLGAATDNLAEGWWMPMLRVPGETLDGQPSYRALIRERGAPRHIIVNAAGSRFADEASPYNDFGKAMHRRDASGGYPNDPAFMVFDEGFRQRYPLPGVPPHGECPSWVMFGKSIKELAGKLGIDGTGLEAAVGRWNACCAGGNDPDFGRGGNPYDRYGGDPAVTPNPNLGPLDRPPFYGVRVLAGTIGTKGGPVTDANGAVLRPDGEPVPGLYAVGNAAAFWVGDAYPAPGATLAIGMTMGYLAGRHAAGGQAAAGEQAAAGQEAVP